MPAAVLALAVVLRAPLLAGGQIDYDEGVYWQSLRAMAAGHPLFSSVYSSQPPAFLLLLLPLHLALGGGIVAGRLTVLVLFLAGLAAAGRVAWLLAGPWAGVLAAALLAADPLAFRQSLALQADGPSVSLALVGLAAAAEARKRAGSPLLAGAAGAVLAVAVLTKLLALAAIPAALVLLVAPPVPVRRGVLCAGAAVLGGVLATAAVLLPFAGVWPQLWEQTVALHLNARALPLGGLDGPTLLRGLPLAAVGVAGGLVAIRRAPRGRRSSSRREVRRPGAPDRGSAPRTGASLPVVGERGPQKQGREMGCMGGEDPPDYSTGVLMAVTAVAWLASAALLLAAQHPLWPHHAVVLTAPLALLGGALALPLTRGGRAAATAAGSMLMAASVVSALYVSSLQEPGQLAAPTVAALRANTAPGDQVVTDDQYVVALAGRGTPPELVDTSFVRVSSGDLTQERVEAIASRPQVRAVLLASGRLAGEPGLRAWLEREFPRTVNLGNGQTLYVRQ